MTKFEIIVTIILCIICTSTVLLWGNVTLLIGKILEKFETEKKPASKNETDDKK